MTDFPSPTPPWFIKHSDSLGQKIAFNRETGWIVCQDGTEYSPEENAALKKNGAPTPLLVHLIKKIFEGTIISKS